MKLHDLQPPKGAHKSRTRVGRGIAAGQGKTAGRGTKGQKARAGGSIPPWFEGGQTPLHMRIPKLRGFKNRFKVEYEVVNIGAIGALAEGGAFEAEAPAKGKAKASAPITINQDILRAVGLVRTLDKPLKVLGAGDVSTPLFVVADAFSASARAKIEAAGGSVNVIEVPTTKTPALKGSARSTETEAAAAEAPAAEAAPAEEAAPAKPAKSRAKAAKAEAETDVEAPEAVAVVETVAEPTETEAPQAATETPQAATEDENPEASATDDETPEASVAEDTDPQDEAGAASDEAETTSGDDA